MVMEIMSIEQYVEEATHRPYTYMLVRRGLLWNHTYDIFFEDTAIRRVRMDQDDVESYLAALNGAWMLGWNRGFATASDFAVHKMKEAAVENSRKGEVDRQGDTFTQDELNGRENWR
jgi:hypothetical protein